MRSERVWSATDFSSTLGLVDGDFLIDIHIAKGRPLPPSQITSTDSARSCVPIPKWSVSSPTALGFLPLILSFNKGCVGIVPALSLIHISEPTRPY